MNYWGAGKDYRKAVRAYNNAFMGIMEHKLQSMALGVLQEAYRNLASEEQLRQVTGLFEEHIRIWGKEGNKA